jgi:hypothetical protein
MGKYKDEHGKTRVGEFLKKTAPHILEAVSDVLPNKGVLGVVKNLISNDKKLTTEDKEIALKLLEKDLQEMQEVSKRWSYDMNSDSWLSKNVRPLVLVYLTLFMTFIMFTDSKGTWNFDVKESYISLIETLLLAVYLAYFGSRAYTKGKKIKNK